MLQRYCGGSLDNSIHSYLTKALTLALPVEQKSKFGHFIFWRHLQLFSWLKRCMQCWQPKLLWKTFYTIVIIIVPEVGLNYWQRCRNNGIPPCSFNISDNCCWIKAFDFHEDFYIPPQNLLPWWWWLWWWWWWWYWLSLLRRMRKLMVNMIWSSISDVLCPHSLWVKEYQNFIKVSCQDHTSIDQYFNSCQISLFRKQSTHILSNTRTHQQQQTNKQI